MACLGPGNSGQTTIDASLEEAVPWTNGGTPVLEAGAPPTPVIPAVPSFPPIWTGMPDPGPGPVDCSVLDGIETSPGYYDSFEPAVPQDVGVAIAWTGFDDATRGSFHVPGDVTWYSGNLQASCGPPRCSMGYSVWGLAADNSISGPSCGGVPNNWTLHYRGGLFTNWGGGVSSVFTDPDPTDYCLQDGGLCAPQPGPDAAFDTAGIPVHPPGSGPDGGYQQSHAFLDASAWDGVAFWARTGPEGNPQLILTITDNFTSDRLARENQKYCRRLRKCVTRCLNYAPCTLENDPTGTTVKGVPLGKVYRCFDPDSGAWPFPGGGPTSTASDVPALTDLLYPRCGPSACTSPSTYVDLDFDGKQCRPYTFPAADYSAEYCYNPGDPNPPDRDEQCLDGWASAVTVSTDWKYYTVPFSQLRQGGFGKVAPYFNLKAIDTIAFTIIVGWADFYVDNVSFYRRTN